MKTAFPTLLVPVEVKMRELKARLLVAGHAVARGFPVLVGPSHALHQRPEDFPVGVILENDITPACWRFAAQARDLGFRLVAWDEEAISVLSDAWYVRQRVNEETLALFDLFFTRGQGDLMEIGARHPAFRDRLVPAGNPRLDLLRNGHELSTRTAADGPIMVMSRFSRSNPFAVTRVQALENAKRKFRFSEEDGSFYEGFLNHTHAIFERFFPMVGRMAERFSERELVLRPHPAENVSLWKELAASHSNLRVETGDTAQEWAARSAVVVHNGCTTGLEAALIGCPVLSFRPLISKDFDVPLPNLVSQSCESEESLFSSIASILEREQDREATSRQAWKRVEAEWIGDGGGRMATDIILDSLARFYAAGLPPQSGRTGAVFARRLDRFKQGVKRLFTPPDKERQALREAYLRQKFPPTGAAEIENLLAELGFSHLCVKPSILGWWVVEKRA